MPSIPLQVARGLTSLVTDVTLRVVDLATWSARALWACLFPVLSLALGVLGLGAASQGQELLRAMSLTLPTSPTSPGLHHFVAFLVAAIYWAGTMYLACYAVLLGSPGSSLGRHQPRRYGTEEIYPLVPRILAMTGLLSLPVWMLRATADTNATLFGASGQISFVYLVFSATGPATRSRTAFGLSLVALAAHSAAAAPTAANLGAISLGAVGYAWRGRTIQVFALLAWLTNVLVLVGVNDPKFLPYLVMLVVCNLGAFAIHHFDVYSRTHREAELREGDHPAWRQPLGRPALWLIAVGSVVSVLIFGLTVADSILVGNAIGAAAAAFLAFGGWSFLISMGLVYLPRRSRMSPSLFLIGTFLAVATAGRFVDNHALRTVDAPKGARQPLAERYAEWRLGIDPSAPIYLVATSGGGQRAAWWTAATLATLDARSCGSFSRNTFAISGVSGGSLGAATFAAMLADERGRWHREVCSSELRAELLAERTRTGGGGGRLGRFLGADFLSPVFASMLITDAAQLFIPFSVLPHDRAWALERGWELQWERVFGTDRFAAPVDALYAGPARVPELIFNSTVVEDGARAVFSTVELDIPGVYDLLGVEGLGVYPLSAIVHATARFPYVGPAASLYRDPAYATVGVTADGTPAPVSPLYRRVVDGGYHDNSGADTLMEVYDRLPEDDKRRVVLVLITSDPDLRGTCASETSAWPDRNMRTATPWFPELMAPISTATRTQGAHARRSRRQFVDRLACDGTVEACGCDRTIDLAMGDIPSIARLDDRDTPAIVPPLGWFMGTQASAELTAAALSMTDPVALPSGVLNCEAGPR